MAGPALAVMSAAGPDSALQLASHRSSGLLPSFSFTEPGVRVSHCVLPGVA